MASVVLEQGTASTKAGKCGSRCLLGTTCPQSVWPELRVVGACHAIESGGIL